MSNLEKTTFGVLIAIIIGLCFLAYSVSAQVIEEPIIDAGPDFSVVSNETFTKDEYTITTKQVYSTENGKNAVVFVSAEKSGEPVGFGYDGTVETERIRIVNAPTMIWDGTCTDTEVDGPFGKPTTICLRNYTENPAEALREVIKEVVPSIAKEGTVIESGKVGNTTTVVYADEGDALSRKSNATWTTARTAGSADATHNNSTGYLVVGTGYDIYVPFFMFDTSAIDAGDTISSASLSFTLAGDNAGTASNQWIITQSEQATWNSIVNNDFPLRGYDTTAGSAGVDRIVSGATTGVQTINLDSTGISWIAKGTETIPASASASGKTQLALTMTADTSGTAPTTYDYNLIYFATNAGTTDDPFLTVEHSAGGGGGGTTTATTTDFNTDNQTLFQAFILFWITFIFIVWFFKKK